MMARPVLRAAALLVCGLTLVAPVHAADDGGDAVKAVLAEIKAAQKDPDGGGLADAVNKVADIHNGLTAAAPRKKLQTVVGKVLRDEKAGGARSVAAQVLGKLNDPKGAWKQLAKALPNPKSKQAEPAQLAAIKATAVHAPEAAIAPLLKLMQKGKSLDACREAIIALGRYGSSKKREAILGEMLDVMARHHAAAEAAASNPKGGNGGQPWKQLGEALVAAANQLTGQKYDGGPAWLEARKAHKKKLGGLFATQLP